MEVKGRMASRLGMFLNPATGQQLGGTVQGSYTVEATAADGLVPQVNGVLLQAVRDILGVRIASRQLPIEKVATAMPELLGEIAKAAGVERFGARFTALELTVRMDPVAGQ